MTNKPLATVKPLDLIFWNGDDNPAYIVVSEVHLNAYDSEVRGITVGYGSKLWSMLWGTDENMPLVEVIHLDADDEMATEVAYWRNRIAFEAMPEWLKHKQNVAAEFGDAEPGSYEGG